MKVDIDRPTEAELIDLNHKIVARLHFLREMRTHTQMLEFRVGDRVCFQPDGRAVLSGMVTRYNKKTVTVVTERGERWNVSPALLQQAGGSQKAESEGRNVIRFPRK
jgi:ribosomal protein L21E